MLKLFKEPLFHFSLVAALLFLFYQQIWLDEQQPLSQKVIEIDRAAILAYLQNQSGVYDKAQLEQALDSMSEAKLQTLIEGYFREEALYREALSLGLDKHDQAIRRRLIQSMSLMAEQGVTPTQPTQEELDTFFTSRADTYAIDASISFAHVYLAPDSSDDRVRTMFEQLRGLPVGYEQATQFGDRFIYHTNYVQRTPEFIRAHFGPAFTQAVFNPEIQLNEWSAAIQSEHGLHFVLITSRSSARKASLPEVKDAVVNDYLQAMAVKQRESAWQKIAARYQRKLSAELN